MDAENIEKIIRETDYEGLKVCANHPEKFQIFYLEMLLRNEADDIFKDFGRMGYGCIFSLWEELKPGLWEEPGNPETDINWDTYDFRIEIGYPLSNGFFLINVKFNNEGDRTLLKLIDMREAEKKEKATEADGKIYKDLTAEECLGLIKKICDEMQLQK